MAHRGGGTTQLWRTQSTKTRSRPGTLHRRTPFAGQPQKSVASMDFKNHGAGIALKQRREREVDMLRSAGKGVARTLPKDVRPDYTRWTSETRSRLAGTRPAEQRRPHTTVGSSRDLDAIRKTVTLRMTEKRHPKSNLILKHMFSAGASANGAVSENGIAAAEQFYKHARPWQGMPSISYPSKTTPGGTRFCK